MRAFFLLIMAVLLGSCATGLRDWKTIPVDGVSFEDVYNTTATFLESESRLDRAQTDRGRGLLWTQWRVQPAAFSRGKRTRIRVEIERLAPKRFNLHYCVEKQMYKDMATPLYPKEDEWGGTSQDPNSEILIGHHLRLRIADLLGKKGIKAKGVQIRDPMKAYKREH
jgi:hypothetical protein